MEKQYAKAGTHHPSFSISIRQCLITQKKKTHHKNIQKSRAKGQKLAQSLARLRFFFFFGPMKKKRKTCKDECTSCAHTSGRRKRGGEGRKETEQIGIFCFVCFCVFFFFFSFFFTGRERSFFFFFFSRKKILFSRKKKKKKDFWEKKKKRKDLKILGKS